MLKKSVEEMKEMVIKLKQDLHDLLVEIGSTMAMAFDVTDMFVMNYSIMTLVFNVTRVSKVVCEEVWILFHPSLFSIVKVIYVTTTYIVQKRIVVH
jgi:hypothetical protein